MLNETNELLKKSTIPEEADAIQGRNEALSITGIHAVNNSNILRDPEANEQLIVLGMGCFWGAERKFWNTDGVAVTAVGYAGGYTQNPTYEEVCTGQTAHAEVVKVIFNENKTTLESVLKVFWENHDPTQGMRQGNDVGNQYRSVIYTTSPEQAKQVEASLKAYQTKLLGAGFGMITTECEPLGEFFYAEEYHQQYLHKHPNGYCGLNGTGVTCPIGLSV